MHRKESDIVKVLYGLGEINRKHITPDNIEIVIHSHSTAVSCNIYLTHPDCPRLLIWYKTNWVSDNYEFNERNKTIGIQPQCGFCQDILNDLFDSAYMLKEQIKSEKEATKNAEEQRKKEEYASLVDAHRKALACA